MRKVTRSLFMTALFLSAQSAFASGSVDKDYVRSLAVDGKLIAIIEYTDASGGVIERKGYASDKAWLATSPTSFKLSNNVEMQLYGLTPCEGELVVRDEDFAGTCKAYAQENLQIILNAPKVVYCRAFETEKDKPEQTASCYTYFFVKDAVNSVSMIEEDLVSIGAIDIIRNKDGSLQRPDLADALNIGERGYGMWTDPRHKN